MENLKVLLNLLNGLLWISIVITLILFFKPIKEMLKTTQEIIKQRGLKLSTSGVQIPSPTDTLESTKDVFIEHQNFEELFKRQNQVSVFDLPLIEQEQKNNFTVSKTDGSVKNELLDSIHLFLKEKIKLNPKLTKEFILINLLSDAYVNLYFERIFQCMFGSQLQLLLHLLHKPENKGTKENALSLFDAIFHGNSFLSFEKWLHNLEKLKFINTCEEEVFITDEGKQFMLYILEKGYSTKKAG